MEVSAGEGSEGGETETTAGVEVESAIGTQSTISTLGPRDEDGEVEDDRRSFAPTIDDDEDGGTERERDGDGLGEVGSVKSAALGDEKSFMDNSSNVAVWNGVMGRKGGKGKEREVGGGGGPER